MWSTTNGIRSSVHSPPAVCEISLWPHTYGEILISIILPLFALISQIKVILDIRSWGYGSELEVVLRCLLIQVKTGQSSLFVSDRGHGRTLTNQLQEDYEDRESRWKVSSLTRPKISAISVLWPCKNLWVPAYCDKQAIKNGTKEYSSLLVHNHAKKTRIGNIKTAEGFFSNLKNATKVRGKSAKSVENLIYHQKNVTHTHCLLPCRIGLTLVYYMRYSSLHEVSIIFWWRYFEALTKVPQELEKSIPACCSCHTANPRARFIGIVLSGAVGALGKGKTRKLVAHLNFLQKDHLTIDAILLTFDKTKARRLPKGYSCNEWIDAEVWWCMDRSCAAVSSFLQETLVTGSCYWRQSFCLALVQAGNGYFVGSCGWITRGPLASISSNRADPFNILY